MEVGKVVAGRYLLTEKLGEGGFAKVFKAHHQDLKKDFALKLLNPEIARTEEGRERFLREVESTSEVAHKFAVRLREAGRDPQTGWLYFTMDLVQGKTLRAVLKAAPGRALAEDRAVKIAAQTLEVLEEAHARKLVHRDLKPENLMLVNVGTPEEEVRVLDFGISKAVADADPHGALTLTQAGTVVGTPHYMSPEQAKGNKLDPRSDIYSLGVILYEALSGRLPVDADPDAESTIQSLLWNIGSKPPVPLEQVAPQVAPAIRMAVMKALAKDPAERFATARDMRVALLGTAAVLIPIGATPPTGVSVPPPPPPPTQAPPVTPVTPQDPISSDRTLGVGPTLGKPPEGATISEQATGVVETKKPTTQRRLSERVLAAQKQPPRSKAPLVVFLLIMLVAGGVLAVAFDVIELGPELAFAELTPSEGMVVTHDAALLVKGRLTDPGARLLLGKFGDARPEQPVGADGTFSFQVPLTSEGDSVVVFTAERGKHQVTKTISVTHDATAPKLTVQVPHSVREGNEIEVTWTVEDMTAKHLSAWLARADGQKVGNSIEEDITPPRTAGNARFSTQGLTDKAIVHLLATDAAGNKNDYEATVVVLGPIAITITTPKEDALLATGSFTVGGDVTANAEHVDVEVLVDGQHAIEGRIASGPWSGNVRVPADGRHEITVRARDAAGRLSEGTATAHVRVDRKAPKLACHGPSEELPVDGTEARLAIESDEPLASLIVKGKEQVQGEPQAGPWREIVVDVSDGADEVAVTARDVAGNETTTGVPIRRAARDPWANHPVGTTFEYVVYTSRNKWTETWRVTDKDVRSVTLRVETTQENSKVRTVKFVHKEFQGLLDAATGSDDITVPAGQYAKCRSSTSGGSTFWFAEGIPLPVKKVEAGADDERVISELRRIAR